MPVCGVYPGPIDTDMASGIDMEKETPSNVASRVFDGMIDLNDRSLDAVAARLVLTLSARS